MTAELAQNGVELRKKVLVERILVEERAGRKVACGIVARAAGSSAPRRSSPTPTSRTRSSGWRARRTFPPDYAARRGGADQLQLVPGLPRHPQGRDHPPHRRPGLHLASPAFSSGELTDFHTTSRTFSIYYPETRPGSDRYTVVASINGLYADWRRCREDRIRPGEGAPDRGVHRALERFIPGVRQKIDWKEAATPRTIERYTTHAAGTSFGTKFEGLKVSMDLPERLPGLYHAGSVGIIMSGWLGTINYGVIVANKIDRYVCAQRQGGAA
jgi:all-trans-retinol 13,14-reductase